MCIDIENSFIIRCTCIVKRIHVNGTFGTDHTCYIKISHNQETVVIIFGHISFCTQQVIHPPYLHGSKKMQ